MSYCIHQALYPNQSNFPNERPTVIQWRTLKYLLDHANTPRIGLQNEFVQDGYVEIAVKVNAIGNYFEESSRKWVP